MAADKLILVKSVVTTDGVNPLMQGEKIVYKETVLNANAAPIIEQQNKFRPELLKKKITFIGEEEAAKVKAKKVTNDKE